MVINKLVTISVISHGQIELIVDLFNDIAKFLCANQLEVILTLNVPEKLPFLESDYVFLKRIIRNQNSQGFSVNHNRAFSYSTGDFFCVLNPDIRFKSDPFPILLSNLNDQSIGLVAPLMFSRDDKIENSARKFPTPFKIACKALGGSKFLEYDVLDQDIEPDWVGGMFMLFPRKIFIKLAGFDERYFLYYEDVDLCARLKLLGYKILLCPQAKVFHYAQRTSHVNFEYFRWHARSMIRFFCSDVFWRHQSRKWLFKFKKDK